MSVVKGDIEWQEGYVIPSKAPGLGLELNDEFIAANPYLDTELHLEMDIQAVVP